MKKHVLLFLMLSIFSIPAFSGDFYKELRQGWLDKSEKYKPILVKKEKKPTTLVNVIPDKDAFQGWKTVPSGSIENFYTTSFKQQSGTIVDFGEHMTGYFSFSVRSLDKAADGPLRFKFTFGEVPSEMAVPFDPYPGTLSRAWLQDEIITVMEAPATLTIPRRLAFRYVKIELLASSGYFDFVINDMVCQAQTSVTNEPEKLPDHTPTIIKEIEKVSLNTLRECMQTVYEDGPKRDQRLWIGDLYLQSMANNYSFKQYDLAKRCLYLLAGVSDENGYLLATVIEKPYPRPQENQFLFEYSLIFNATLKDYLLATGEKEVGEDLWPVAKKQLDIIRTYVKKDGLIDFHKLNNEWWVFFDWKEDLYKETAVQGFSIFALKETYELAKLLGKEKEIADVPGMIKSMTSAARKHFYNGKSGLFLSPSNPQISYASQIWMIVSGVATRQEGEKALKALATAKDVCYPGTPYLYHYYIQALVDCGMKAEARKALTAYWGGMVEKGADTFWEAYDPENDFISPYNFYPVNSYCHAWSCTPVYFIRKYPEIFQ